MAKYGIYVTPDSSFRDEFIELSSMLMRGGCGAHDVYVLASVDGHAMACEHFRLSVEDGGCHIQSRGFKTVLDKDGILYTEPVNGDGFVEFLSGTSIPSYAFEMPNNAKLENFATDVHYEQGFHWKHGMTKLRAHELLTFLYMQTPIEEVAVNDLMCRRYHLRGHQAVALGFASAAEDHIYFSVGTVTKRDLAFNGTLADDKGILWNVYTPVDFPDKPDRVYSAPAEFDDEELLSTAGEYLKQNADDASKVVSGEDIES